MIDQEINPGETGPETGRHAPSTPTTGEGRAGGPARDAAAHGEPISFAPRRAAAEGEEAGAKAQSEPARIGTPVTHDHTIRVTDEFKQTFDVWTRHGADLVRGSREHLQALADCNAFVARGALDISRAWIDLLQAGAQRRADSFAALLRCRTAEAFATVEGRRLQENLEQLVDTHRRVAALSLDVLQGVGDALIGKEQAAAAP